MENCYVVQFKENEKKEFCLFLRLFGFKWANGKSFGDEPHQFPFCIDVKRKVVYLTNVNFLREFKNQGGEMVGVQVFKNMVEA